MCRNDVLLCALAVAFLACGGGDEPPAGLPAQQPVQGPASAPETTAVAAVAPDQDTASADTTRVNTGLVRETFVYRGAGRDPFVSLLRSGEVRPLVEDLRVTAITYTEAYARLA